MSLIGVTWSDLSDDNLVDAWAPVNLIDTGQSGSSSHRRWVVSRLEGVLV